jgi:hypothetical protein
VGEDSSGAPKITPVIDGIEGNNGWYTSNVTVRWKIDTENEVYEKETCDPVTIDYDTASVKLTCWVGTDGGEAEEGVTIKRDTSLGHADPPNGIEGFEFGTPATSGASEH